MKNGAAQGRGHPLDDDGAPGQTLAGLPRWA